MAGLNVLTYLTAYLDECGRNGGKPLTGQALERFLPWNASPEDLRTWAQPPPARRNPGSVTPHRRGRQRIATPALGMPFHRTSAEQLIHSLARLVRITNTDIEFSVFAQIMTDQRDCGAAQRGPVRAVIIRKCCLLFRISTNSSGSCPEYRR